MNCKKIKQGTKISTFARRLKVVKWIDIVLNNVTPLHSTFGIYFEISFIPFYVRNSKRNTLERPNGNKFNFPNIENKPGIILPLCSKTYQSISTCTNSVQSLIFPAQSYEIAYCYISLTKLSKPQAWGWYHYVFVIYTVEMGWVITYFFAHLHFKVLSITIITLNFLLKRARIYSLSLILFFYEQVQQCNSHNQTVTVIKLLIS